MRNGHNTACSYHCCNFSNGKAVSNNGNVTILLAVITVATKQNMAMMLWSTVTILLAVITVATSKRTLLRLLCGTSSQYCLQLSLLQQQGLKTLAPSRVWRPFCATK